MADSERGSGSQIRHDRALVRRLLAGDEAAFERFFDDYFGGLYRFALTRLDHDEEPTATAHRMPPVPGPVPRRLSRREGHPLGFGLKVASDPPPAHRTPDRTAPAAVGSGERRGPRPPSHSARRRFESKPEVADGHRWRRDPAPRTAGRGRCGPPRFLAGGSWCRDSISPRSHPLAAKYIVSPACPVYICENKKPRPKESRVAVRSGRISAFDLPELRRLRPQAEPGSIGGTPGLGVSGLSTAGVPFCRKSPPRG